MKKAIIALLFIASVGLAEATPPPITYTIEADYQQAQSLPDQSFQQGAGVRLRYKLMSNGSYLSLAGLTAKWQGRSSAASTNYITQTTATTVTNVTPNYFQFDLDSTATGSSLTNWVYSMITTYNSIDYVMGTGRLDIVASSWAGSSAALTADSYVSSIIAGTGISVSPTNGVGDVTVTSTATGDNNMATKTNWNGSVVDGDLPMRTNSITQVKDMCFIPNGGNTNQGAVYASSDEDTLNYQTEIAGVVEQLGQELQVPSSKDGGDSISNGELLVITGAGTGDKPKVQAVGASSDLGKAFSVSTHTWADNEGRGTSFGLVRDLNTLAIGTAGAEVWGNTNGLSTNQLTDSIFIGWITRSHATDGAILVNMDRAETDPFFKSVSNNYQLVLSEGAFVDGDKTKLDGIETGAEVNNISDVNATDLTDGGETTLHTHPATAGGGSVTNLRQYLYINPTVEFAYNSTTFLITINHPSNSRTMKAGSFPKDETIQCDIMWFDTEDTWSGNFNLQGLFWTDGTTNLTGNFGGKVYHRLTGAELGSVTSSAVTVQSGSAMTNRQAIDQTFDLSGLVATNGGGFGFSPLWYGTNDVSGTRTSDFIQEYFSGAVVY